MDRRTFVTIAGAATVAGVAGCLDDSTGSGELETASDGFPAYAEWIGPASSEYLVMRMDFERSMQIDAYQLDEQVDQSGNESISPDQEGEQESNKSPTGNQSENLEEAFGDVSSIAEAYPAVSAIGPALFLAFSGLVYPFISDIEYVGDESEDVENPVLKAEAMTLAGDAMILEGDVNEDTLASREDVTELDTHAGFTVYGSANSFGGFFGEEEGESGEDGTSSGGGGGPEDSTNQENLSPFAADGERIVLPLGDDGGDSGEGSTDDGSESGGGSTGDGSSEETGDGGDGETSASESESKTDREVLESALEIASAGVDIGHDDLAWLLEQCGNGAMAVAAAGDDLNEESGDQETQQSDIDLSDMNIDQEKIEAFRDLLKEKDGTAITMVTDAHDDGRVTRSGFAFDTSDQVPDGDELANIIASGANDTNVVIEDNRIVVEAFWG